MTSIALKYSPSGVTSVTEGDLEAAIRRALDGSDDAGVSLNAVLQTAVSEGYDPQAVSSTIMHLIRSGVVDLTAERNLRWVGEAAS